LCRLKQLGFSIATPQDDRSHSCSADTRCVGAQFRLLWPLPLQSLLQDIPLTVSAEGCPIIMTPDSQSCSSVQKSKLGQSIGNISRLARSLRHLFRDISLSFDIWILFETYAVCRLQYTPFAVCLDAPPTTATGRCPPAGSRTRRRRSPETDATRRSCGGPVYHTRTPKRSFQKRTRTGRGQGAPRQNARLSRQKRTSRSVRRRGARASSRQGSAREPTECYLRRAVR
jgi:hypothetical protein